MPRLHPLVLPALLSLLAPAVAEAALTQTFQQTGALGLEVTGAAGQNQPMVTGTLTLNNLPPGATIQWAMLYASQNGNATNPLTAIFNGVPLGAVGPSASDPAFLTLYTYQWNVAGFITPALPSFGFSVSETVPGFGIAAVGLVIVWQDPLEPTRTVTIIEGMKQVGESGPETETVTFTGLPSGSTQAWILTAYDDNAATGEVVRYNGIAIGGPIDQNLGLNASVLQMSATSVTGSNTMSIQTGADHMGWMIAATAVDLPPVSVEPRTWSRVKGLYR